MEYAYAEVIRRAADAVALGRLAGGVACELLFLTTSGSEERFIELCEDFVALQLAVSGRERGELDVGLVLYERVVPSARTRAVREYMTGRRNRTRTY